MWIEEFCRTGGDALLRDGAVREEGNGLDFVAWPMTPEAFATVLRNDMA